MPVAAFEEPVAGSDGLVNSFTGEAEFDLGGVAPVAEDVRANDAGPAVKEIEAPLFCLSERGGCGPIPADVLFVDQSSTVRRAHRQIPRGIASRIERLELSGALFEQGAPDDGRRLRRNGEGVGRVDGGVRRVDVDRCPLRGEGSAHWDRG